ncbi:MAG TPA: hypothetical protein VH593_06320 [Ktedonobacteraceae bacterium]|jgi:hypothetical protein
MTDPVLPPTIPSEFQSLVDRIDRLERSSKMPPVVVDSWALNNIMDVSAGWTLVARKVVLAPAYGVIQAEGYIVTGADAVGEVYIKERYSGIQTSTLSVAAGSTGIARFTWDHPFDVGWQGKAIELQWWARRASGSTIVQSYMPWLLTFAGSSYLAGQSDGKPEFIGSTAPPAPPPPPPPPPTTPTTRTDQYACIGAGSWRPQGGWVKTDLWQGASSSGWGPYIGIALYDFATIRSSLSGRTVNSAAILVTRITGIGIYGAQPLYVGIHNYAAIPGGQPSVAFAGRVGDLAVSQTAWLPIPPSLILAIRDSGQCGLGCVGDAYMETQNWTLQITSTG